MTAPVVDTLPSERSEWRDMQPVRLSDGAQAAVNICHSEAYLDTFGLLYACMQAGELSKRVLRLTEQCIGLCSSHYTAWDYRFQVRPHCTIQTNRQRQRNNRSCKRCRWLSHQSAKLACSKI